jgi:sensor histidine kinase YesM
MQFKLIRGRYKLFFHAGFWLIFLILSFFFYANFWPLHIAVIRSALNGTLFILLFYINLEVLIPKFFSKGKHLLYVIASILLIGAFIPVRIAFREYWFGEPSAVVIRGRPYLSEFLIVTSLLFVFMISVFYKLVESQLLSLERNREIVRQRDEAELRMLKSQVNPHFLFNTLNNLYSLAYTRSAKTPGAIMSLSEIMRYLIYETGATLVSAEKEVRFLTNYISLEKLRIEDAGKVSLSVEQPGPGLLISPLLFIAFVENAFKHSGIDTDPEGFIQVFLSFRDDEINFTCENSIPADKARKTEGGVGLVNARARLELMYPGKYTLDIRQSALVYSVSLTLKP